MAAPGAAKPGQGVATAPVPVPPGVPWATNAWTVSSRGCTSGFEPQRRAEGLWPAIRELLPVAGVDNIQAGLGRLDDVDGPDRLFKRLDALAPGRLDAANDVDLPIARLLKGVAELIVAVARVADAGQRDGLASGAAQK